MANIINADNGVVTGSSGIKYSADASGTLQIQTNGNTAISIDANTGVTMVSGLIMNSNTINNNITIPDGYNAGSFGPVSVANTATVTVANTATWTVI
jgi:hypothetical protein